MYHRMTQLGAVRSFVSSPTKPTQKKNKEYLFLKLGYNPVALISFTYNHRQNPRRRCRCRFNHPISPRVTAPAASHPKSHLLRALRVSTRTTLNNVLMAVPQSSVPTTIELQCEQLPNSHPTHQISLPRSLSRPLFRAITPETIAAIDPILAGVPLGYILYNLKDIGPKLSEGVKATQAIPPRGPLPREMAVKFNNSAELEPPTHILAVHSKQQSDLFTLYPVHALVVSTGCAHLPLLPESPAIPPGAARSELTLPVVSLSIPSPSMFQPILNYLYMRQNDGILNVLLPIEDNEVDPFIEMSKKQADQFSVKELLINARKIWGLWANASALGIFDDHLFTTLEIAWEICIGALNLSLNKPLDSGVDVPPED